jgi:hypothetical protein
MKIQGGKLYPDRHAGPPPLASMELHSTGKPEKLRKRNR